MVLFRLILGVVVAGHFRLSTGALGQRPPQQNLDYAGINKRATMTVAPGHSQGVSTATERPEPACPQAVGIHNTMPRGRGRTGMPSGDQSAMIRGSRKTQEKLRKN